MDLNQKLQKYVQDLQSRFVFKGPYDTHKIPTGELFIEVVCGAVGCDTSDDYCYYPPGVVCTTPEAAFELFKDSFERHIIQNHTKGILHWHTYPDIHQCTCQLLSIQSVHTNKSSDVIQEILYEKEIRYSIYARAVLVGD